MKKQFQFLAILLVVLVSFSSCEFVRPNYAGVLMENYGKSGKEDFSLQSGKVWTAAPGTELFQVPLYDQRAFFEDVLNLKASDGTEFTAKPKYSYKVIRDRAVDIVFNNKHITSGEEFMKSLEDNILEAVMYDIIKEQSKGYDPASLMAVGGTLKFEKHVEKIIEEAFSARGLMLITFEANIDFEDKVKNKITTGNEVNANIATLDKQIIEQRKKNEYEELKAEALRIRSRGLTPEILEEMRIKAWEKGGSKVPYSVGSTSPFLFNIK
jgi:hypothetical protein